MSSALNRRRSERFWIEVEVAADEFGFDALEVDGAARVTAAGQGELAVIGHGEGVIVRDRALWTPLCLREGLVPRHLSSAGLPGPCSRTQP